MQAREIDAAQRVGQARNAEHQSAPIESRIEKQNRKKRKRKSRKRMRSTFHTCTSHVLSDFRHWKLQNKLAKRGERRVKTASDTDRDRERERHLPADARLDIDLNLAAEETEREARE